MRTIARLSGQIADLVYWPIYHFFHDSFYDLQYKWELFLTTPTKEKEEALGKSLDAAISLCDQHEWESALDTLRSAYEMCGKGWYPHIQEETRRKTYIFSEKCTLGLYLEINKCCRENNFKRTLKLLDICEKNDDIPFVCWSSFEDFKSEI